MRVIVIADTHMPKKGERLPERLLRELAHADMIIHAGDWSSMSVYHELAGYAPVKGVYGNIDDEDIIHAFPYEQVVEVNGYRIGVTHGHGEKRTTEKRVLDVFEEDKPDVIIFGHSHIPMMRYLKKTLLLNPGSPTDKRWLPHYSFAVLEVGNCLHAEWVFFDE